MKKFLLAYTFALSLLRAFRLPNDWAEAHWLLGYGQGIYKRGLVGTFVSALFPPERAHAAEMFISVVAVALTVWAACIAWRISLRQPLPVALVMASSPLIVMWGHLTGYFDFFLFVLTFLALCTFKKQKPFVASLLLTIGILIHESILLTGFPVMLFAVVFGSTFSGVPEKRTETFRNLVRVFALPLAVAIPLLFLVAGTDTHAGIMAYLQAYGFVPDSVGVIADAHNTSFSTYFEKQSPVFWQRMFHTLYIPVYVGLIYFLIHLHQTERVYRKALPWMYPVIFLPLLLHLVAWDTARIWTYPFLEILLLWFVYPPVIGNTKTENTAAFIFAGLLLFVQIGYEIPLMDDEQERWSLLWRLLLFSPVWSYLAYRAIRLRFS